MNVCILGWISIYNFIASIKPVFTVSLLVPGCCLRHGQFTISVIGKLKVQHFCLQIEMYPVVKIKVE